MNSLAEFHFLHPWWLSGLLPLIGLLWHLHRQKRQQGDWLNHCDVWLLSHILIDRPGPANNYRLSLLGLAGLLALLALADPVWQREPTPGFRNQHALVIALSLAESMDATDVKPSRLERARFKITDLLQMRKDGQTALLAYAGDAYTVTPLTDDSETIRAQLAALHSDTLPLAGSRVDLALQQAEQLLRQAGMREGQVLLISDSAAGTEAAHSAERLRERGYRVSVLAVGTEQGAPIAQSGGGFVKDANGAIVIAKLDSAALQAIATAGGGRYLPMSNDNSDVQALAGFFEQAVPKNLDTTSKTQLEHWRETGPWLLLPLLPLAAMAFRRGLIRESWDTSFDTFRTNGKLRMDSNFGVNSKLLMPFVVSLSNHEWQQLAQRLVNVVVLLLLIPWSGSAMAWDWRNLWQTPDQQAQQIMQQQDYPQAAEHFQDPAWKAAALYRAGQYSQAAETLTGLDDADSLYNRGNALSKAGQYPEAVAAYEQALKKNPKLEDARFNKELVEKLLKEQEKHQTPKDEKNQDPHKDGKNAKDDQTGKDKQDKGQSGKDQDKSSNNPDKTKQDKTAAPNKPDKKAQLAAQDKSTDKADTPDQSAAAEQAKPDETQQANEAWLKRIPDDPGGLLKRKFQRQHQQRQAVP